MKIFRKRPQKVKKHNILPTFHNAALNWYQTTGC